MRSGYKVESTIYKADNFIAVSNIEDVNRVENLSFYFEINVRRIKSNTTVGFWRIKRK